MAGAPPTHSVLRPWLPPSAEIPTLPAIRMQRDGGPSVVCAAYRAECIGHSYPPRARLSLATGTAGIGLGIPAPGGGWQLRNTDFCKGPPYELRHAQKRWDKGTVPRPEDCICPTASLEARKPDPLGSTYTAE